MKDKNIFVSENTLAYYAKKYNELKERRDNTYKIINYYNDLYIKNPSSENNLNFRNVKDLYQIVTELLEKEDFHKQIDLHELQFKLKSSFTDLNDYIKAKKEVKEIEKEIEEILDSTINFDVLETDCELCLTSHCFAKIDGHLTCIFCGAGTKDYGLTNDEEKLLEECAFYHDILIKDIHKKDLPFIRNYKDHVLFERSMREQIDLTDEESYQKLEEEFLENETIIPILKSKIKTAKCLDSKMLSSKYLEDDQAALLLSKIEKEKDEIKNSDSRFKDMLIEECEIAEYEILLLNGKYIPSLIDSIKTEDELIKLAKAYESLNNDTFKDSIDIFPNRFEAISYDALTMNPILHNKIKNIKR